MCILRLPCGFGRPLRETVEESPDIPRQRVLYNGGDGRSQCRTDGKCHRKQTARKGKGEKVG